MLILVGKDHPAATHGSYAYEHHLVWFQTHGEMPGPNEVIHHRNRVKTDNRPENLEKLTVPAHRREHMNDQGRNRSGRFA